jgi:hypothetical protein
MVYTHKKPSEFEFDLRVEPRHEPSLSIGSANFLDANRVRFTLSSKDESALGLRRPLTVHAHKGLRVCYRGQLSPLKPIALEECCGGAVRPWEPSRVELYIKELKPGGADISPQMQDLIVDMPYVIEIEAPKAGNPEHYGVQIRSGLLKKLRPGEHCEEFGFIGMEGRLGASFSR